MCPEPIGTAAWVSLPSASRSGSCALTRSSLGRGGSTDWSPIGFRARLPVKHWRKPKPVIAVLPLSGIIGGVSHLRRGLHLQSLAPRIERAFKLKHLAGVALAVNSPGGSPVQSGLIGKRIRDLAEEKDVSVHAFIEDVGASGGYWLACSADRIYAQPTSIVGSIGVVSGGFGFTEMISKLGIEGLSFTLISISFLSKSPFLSLFLKLS